MSDRRLQSSRDDRIRKDGDRRDRRRSRSPHNRSRRDGNEIDSYSSSRGYREREREERYGGRRDDRDWGRDRGSARRDARRDDDGDRRRDRRGERDDLFDGKNYRGLSQDSHVIPAGRPSRGRTSRVGCVCVCVCVDGKVWQSRHRGGRSPETSVQYMRPMCRGVGTGGVVL